jgi:hypothetical protein
MIITTNYVVLSTSISIIINNYCFIIIIISLITMTITMIITCRIRIDLIGFTRVAHFTESHSTLRTPVTIGEGCSHAY